MARVFRHTYTTKDRNGGRVTKTARKWYGEFTDLLRQVKRVPLCTDKRASRQALDALCEALSKAQAHATVTPDDLPPVIRKPFYTALKVAGHRDAIAANAYSPLSAHLNDWHAVLLAKGDTAKHANLVSKRARRVVDECEFAFWPDLSASKVQMFLADLRNREGLSVQTSNFYLQAIKQFCRWMVLDGRATESPMVYLQGGNVKTDRRHDRRDLDPQQARHLFEVTYRAPRRFKMTGPERVMLYVVTAETGFRVKELRSLTPAAFDLDGDPPTVTVRAGYSKRRREDVQPIRLELAADLQCFMAEMPRTKPVFNMPEKMAKMLRADLKDAGIPYEDDAGRVFDFHALRHTFISNLKRAGVHPKDAQMLARHSTIELTMNTYTHTVRSDLAAALEKLPDLSPRTAKQTHQATGTDGQPSKTHPGIGEKVLVDFLAENLPERGSSPEPPQSSHGTEAKTSEESKCAASTEHAGTSDSPVHPETPHDIVGKELRPAGLEPTTYGLGNRWMIP